MRNPKSKPKREAEVAPKVKINSPTSIETSTGFHLLEFHGPTVSNIVILGAFACFTALRVVFLYRHLSKKRRRKEARLLQAGRADPETGMAGAAQSPHRQLMNPLWSAGGPHPGTAYPAGAPSPHDALPYILAMARRHEEQEFQRGASRMTELLDDIQPCPRQATVHALDELRKAANHRAADELDAIVMANLGRPSVRQAGPTTSGSPAPLHGTSPV